MSARTFLPLALIAFAPLALAACGGAAAASNGSLDAASRLAKSPQVEDAKGLAPQVYAAAQADLVEAQRAKDAGDQTSAELYAERASATFARAVSVARAARATKEGDAARERLARADEERQRLDQSLATLERETDDLEKKLKIAREAALPAASGKASPEREAARIAAARAMLTEAQLVCSAAALLSTDAEVGQALADVGVESKRADEAERQRSASGPVIDAAARLRARCVGLVTKARRATSEGATATDTWLADLSSAGFAPSRDERGVVVTFRPVWGEADAPPKDVAPRLAELGRFAAQNGAAILIVTHEAAPPTPRDLERAERRAAGVKAALVSAGVDGAKVRLESAGARAPVVDPSDAARRGRNARVEIVLVR